MQAAKQSTVLIAQVSGSEQLLQALGQTAGARTLAECMQRMRASAEGAGGRFVRSTGTEMTAVFETPASAAAAASRMHAVVRTLPWSGNVRLGVHVGFHSGPVTETKSDVLGDTVKLAARLLRVAQSGQTLTSKPTAAQLTPSFEALSKKLYTEPVAFGSSASAIYAVTSQPRVPRPAPRAAERLQLRYAGNVIACWRENESVVIGRERGCGFVVDAPRASRRHCTVRFTGDGFIVTDHSRHGTYVTNEGGVEVRLQDAKLPLAAHGWLGFGESRASGAALLEFSGE